MVLDKPDNDVAALRLDVDSTFDQLVKNDTSYKVCLDAHDRVIADLQNRVGRLERMLMSLSDELIIIRPPRSKRRWRFWA